MSMKTINLSQQAYYRRCYSSSRPGKVHLILLELLQKTEMKAYSIDFRRKIIKAYEDESISQRQLAKRFGVAKSFIQKLLKRYRETDSVAPKQRTQQTPPKLTEDHLAVLQQLVEEQNDATLEDLRVQLAAKIDVVVSRSTIDRALKKLDLTIKKRPSMPMKRIRNGSN